MGIIRYFLQTSNPIHRRTGLAVLLGIITGVIGGFVKWGWEVPFPPRDPNVFWPIGAMERVTPPKVFLDQLGLPDNWTYFFSGVDLPLSIFMVHIGFSLVSALIYCVLAEYFPKIKIGYGMVYGIACYVVAHVIIMPTMGLVPPLAQIPFDENASEFFGHMFWMLMIEITRHDIRYRITGYGSVEDEDR